MSILLDHFMSQHALEQAPFWQIFVKTVVKFPSFIIQSKNSAGTREFSETCDVIMRDQLLSNLETNTAGSVRWHTPELTVNLYMLPRTLPRLRNT